MPTSRIVKLAQLIVANFEVMEQHLHDADQPSPSFDITAPPLFPKHDTLNSARDALLSATTELKALVLGAKESLQVLAGSHNELVSLNVISRFKIANSFPISEGVTYSKVAEVTGLSELVVRRILRHLMINNIFTETMQGTVRHTAASALLAQDKDMQDFVAVAVEDLWKAATCVVDAMVKWPQSEEPTETGFSLANDTNDPFYVEIGKNGERTARFAGAMRAFSAGSEYSSQELTKSFDWGSSGAALVVNVGGSHSATSLALAEEYPDLHFVVQDLPAVISALPALPKSSVTSRIRFMAHDFFTPQSITGADVWAQGHAIKILRALVPALKKGALIVVSDMCIADRHELSVWRDRRVRQMDMSKLVMLNSSERDTKEWKALFHAGDKRFEFQGVCRLSNAIGGLAVIVAHWKGE